MSPPWDAPDSRGGGAQEYPPLHKDLYKCNPDPTLQTEEFCWGDLEEAHPVLGKRSAREVTEYRTKQGIEVENVRGRPPPKPFQSFGETSFPGFVEELAYELFTEEAKPYAVQAQAWPCILSGADVVAVAPTGSGKTLAFLLPAVVHIMVQPKLQRGEGPIAVVLQHSRELVQQTLAIANRICERTSGEDTLRAGAVFGGVDPNSQVPSVEGPDFGRWPEILVATPGRLAKIVPSKLSLTRVSYVVLDEADKLLSFGVWVADVRNLLRRIRPDRQLLMLSATWPVEAERVALELCGDELTRIRVEPHVPPILQEVRLFPGDQPDNALNARRGALIEWLRSELREDEAALVLSMGHHNATDIYRDEDVRAAVGGGTAIMVQSMTPEERRLEYWRFLRGQARMLSTTYEIGSRGLDYADSTAAADSVEHKLNLVVILFDFPHTITDYAHAIGRTHRPSQGRGRAVVFLPEFRFWIARELRQLLEHCGQPVPESLTCLIEEDEEFQSKVRDGMLLLREGSPPFTPTDGDSCESWGKYDDERGLWTLPPSIPSYRRRLLHYLSEELGLPHISTGIPRNGRALHLARKRSALPDVFFIMGEEVLYDTAVAGAEPLRGVVTDHKINFKRRTIRIRFNDGTEREVPADSCKPVESGE